MSLVIPQPAVPPFQAQRQLCWSRVRVRFQQACVAQRNLGHVGHLLRPFNSLRESHASASAILGNKLDAGLFERLGNSDNSFIGHLDWPPSFCAF